MNPNTVAVHGNPIVSYRTPPTKGPIKALQSNYQGNNEMLVSEDIHQSSLPGLSKTN